MGSHAVPAAVTAGSPNFGERRGGARPSLIVLHYTGMESCDAARARLCDPAAEVSAHWLISETGHVDALVPEAARAWHAGAGVWAGIDDVNSHSIGIELANSGAHPFTEPQMAALEQLLPAIMARWAIPPQRVIGHSDMAPGRKSDPGPRFDWRRLARQGLAIWPEAPLPAPPQAGDAAAFRAAAQAIGYDPSLPDDLLLRAFRLRFCPWADGPPGPQDLARALALARLSIDRGGQPA